MDPATDNTGRDPATGRFGPGNKGNPKGRPRSGLAFAERVRERIDPDLVIDLALRVAADETISAERRLEALLPLIDRGFIKPPTTIAARVETTDMTPRRDWATVPLEERRALLESIRRVRDPKVLDGGVALLPPPVALAVASTDEE